MLSLDMTLWVNTTARLEVVNPMTIIAVHPSSIIIDSVMDHLVISGSDLYLFSSAECIYNLEDSTWTVNATYLSNTQWRCSSVPNSGQKDSVLTVQLTDSIRHSNIWTVPFVIASLPSIGYIEPAMVERNTGGLITVYGSGINWYRVFLFACVIENVRNNIKIISNATYLIGDILERCHGSWC